MKFSIITVCRNNLEGLKRTYSSIKDQNYQNYEWIVVDALSNDGTQEFLESLNKDNDERYTFISEMDHGLYDGMNKGIDLSTGDFMIFMNSGDMLISPDVLEIVDNELVKHNKVSILYGDSIDFDVEGNNHYRRARHFKLIYRGMFTQHQSMFFAKFEKEHQPKYNLQYKLSADYQFIINYIKKESLGFKIIQLQQPLSKFELGGLNETRRFQAMKEDFQIRKFDLELNLFENNFLYFAHYLHTLLKISVPHFMKKIRYS